jgi:hypothetical protein
VNVTGECVYRYEIRDVLPTRTRALRHRAQGQLRENQPHTGSQWLVLALISISLLGLGVALLACWWLLAGAGRLSPPETEPSREERQAAE